MLLRACKSVRSISVTSNQRSYRLAGHRSLDIYRSSEILSGSKHGPTRIRFLVLSRNSQRLSDTDQIVSAFLKLQSMRVSNIQLLSHLRSVSFR